jgi:hypothetical protein
MGFQETGGVMFVLPCLTQGIVGIFEACRWSWIGKGCDWGGPVMFQYRTTMGVKGGS